MGDNGAALNETAACGSFNETFGLASLNETVAAATLMRRDAGHRLMMEDGARKQKAEKQGDGNVNGTTTMTGLFTTTTQRHDDTTMGLTAGEHRNAEVDFGGLFLVLAVVEGYKWRNKWLAGSAV